MTGMGAAFRRLAPVLALGVLPMIVLAWSLRVYATSRSHLSAIAPDFRYGLYHQAHELLRTGVAFDPAGTVVNGENRIYTVLTTLLATPLALLPSGVAAWIVTALLIASVFATLAVLGVRDRRAYGAAFLWAPVISAIESGNLTLLLGLVAALAWRYRHRPLAAGALVGLAAALKLFMWPLVLWLLATRRLAGTTTAATALLASALIVLPFGSPIAFLRISHEVANVFQLKSYSLYVLFGETPAARVLWLAGAILVVAAAFVVGTDEGAFTLAIVCCLLFSPIVWIDYFALLLVPIAIVRPRFAPLWLAPLVFWLVPFWDPAPWQIVLALATMLYVAQRIALGSRPESPPAISTLTGGERAREA